MTPAAPTTSQSLSKSELPALTNQALEANLIQISTTLLARGWMLATAESLHRRHDRRRLHRPGRLQPMV